MKKLTLIVLFGIFGFGICHPFFGINVQISGADYSLSPKIAANFANASSIATSLITPSAPIPVKYLYFGNSDFWSLNDLAFQFVYGTRNITVLLGYVFNNLTAAAADNTNYPGVFSKLNISIANAIAELSKEIIYVPIFYLSTVYSLQSDLIVELTNLLTLINGIEAGISQFKLSGLALTSANVLKYIPAPGDATTSLRNLFTLSSYFASNTSLTTTYMNNSYSVLKQSDAIFTSIETQLNASIKSTDVMTNATQLYLNQTLLQFMTSINTTYANVKKALPANFSKDLEYMANVSIVDNNVNSYLNSIVNAKDIFNQNLESYKTTTKQTISSWYQANMDKFNSARTSIFNDLMMENNNLRCAKTLVSTLETQLKNLGGSSFATFCGQTDVAMLSKFNATIKMMPKNTSTTATDFMFRPPFGGHFERRCVRWRRNCWVFPYVECIQWIWVWVNDRPFIDVFDPVTGIFSNWISTSQNNFYSCGTIHNSCTAPIINPLYDNYIGCIRHI